MPVRRRSRGPRIAAAKLRRASARRAVDGKLVRGLDLGETLRSKDAAGIYGTARGGVHGDRDGDGGRRRGWSEKRLLPRVRSSLRTQNHPPPRRETRAKQLRDEAVSRRYYGPWFERRAPRELRRGPAKTPLPVRGRG